MAITPKSSFVSPIKLSNADSDDQVYIIVGPGAPDGASDPQASADIGTLYIRDNQSDDQVSVYLKVDDSDADGDWVLFVAQSCTNTVTLSGDVTMSTDTAIQFRDSGQKLYSPAANTVAMALAAASDVFQMGRITSSHYIQIDSDGELTLVGNALINPSNRFTLRDDFDMQQVWVEAETPWILNSGLDAEAIDPAINAQERGVVRLTTGDDDGTTAQDGSQMVCHIPVQADSGGLVIEARLHINTAITNVAVFIGLTDSTALEEPFTNAADVITANATDACGFLYDTDATTDEWWVLAVDSGVADASNAATGTPPVADTYQILRVEVPANGNLPRYYIDGTLEGTLTTGVSPNVNLYATVIACGDGTASKTVDVDYLWVSHNR